MAHFIYEPTTSRFISTTDNTRPGIFLSRDKIRAFSEFLVTDRASLAAKIDGICSATIDTGAGKLSHMINCPFGTNPAQFNTKGGI
jgi:hypothetical protein